MQDPDLIAMLGDTEPTDPTLARAWNQYAKFRAYLAAESRLPSTVAAAAVFTVQDASALARKLAAQVAAAPAPVITDLTLCDGVATSPCAPVGDTGRACGDSAGAFWELHGRLAIPNYQAGTLHRKASQPLFHHLTMLRAACRDTPLLRLAKLVAAGSAPPESPC